MTARPLPLAALREVARIAREEGVTVRVERGADGSLLYDVCPKAQPVVTNPADLVDMSE